MFIAVYFAVFVERIVLVHALTDFPLKPYLRLLALLSVASIASLLPFVICRLLDWAPLWRLLVGTLLGWATVAHFLWHQLLTEGEEAWLRRKLTRKNG